MPAKLGIRVTGLNAPGTPQRRPQAWLNECRSFLALVATRETYAAQPRLWELGEFGRARTTEDFEHHLRGPDQLAALARERGIDLQRETRYDR